jgi:colanic acid/amylovoran biosynthesis protein
MVLKKIAIIGGTLWGNRGAEAMLETLIGQLRNRYPEAQFYIYTYYPTKDAALINDPTVHILSATPANLVFSFFPGALISRIFSSCKIRLSKKFLPNEVVKLRECDVLLDIAGISFSDGREKFLPFNILTILPAFLLAVPVVKCAQAMGPFEGTLNQIAAKFTLSKCALLFGRGKDTLHFLYGLGLAKNKIHSAADLAFNHEFPFALTDENGSMDLLDKLERWKSNNLQIICLNPSSLVAAQCHKNSIEFAKIMGRTITELINKNFCVFLIPTATRGIDDKNLHNNDLPVIKEIVEHIRDDVDLEKLGWVENDLNFAAIKTLMSAANIVVTFRFHGLVAALSLNIPTIAIGWGHKYRELMNQFNQENLSLDFNNLGSSDLIEKILYVCAHQKEIQDELRSEHDVIKNESLKQIEMITNLNSEIGQR